MKIDNESFLERGDEVVFMVHSSSWPSCVCLAAGAESVLQPRDANENPGIVRYLGT